MSLAYIALGSNVRPRRKNCEKAVQALEKNPRVVLLKGSSWYNTKALTLPGETQPDFINGVIQIGTSLSAEELYSVCKQIEKKLGRKKRKKLWQPRLIDLDILFYGKKILKTKTLTIPHPLLHQRLFVLRPLAEIAPRLQHPILKKAVARLLKDCYIRGRSPGIRLKNGLSLAGGVKRPPPLPGDACYQAVIEGNVPLYYK